jgi:RND family efflux transporter MFP subunit
MSDLHSPHYSGSPRRGRRIAIISSSLALIAAVSVYSVTRVHAATEKTASAATSAPAAPKVTVAPVEEKLLTDFEEITGRVEATETVDLRARVSGHVDAVHFQAGQIVHKGDVLFTIDPRWYRAQFDLATAQAAQARAHAEVAAREATRADELLAASAISHEEAEARRSREIEARAAQTSAEAAAQTAKLDLENTSVRAPHPLRVGSVARS